MGAEAGSWCASSASRLVYLIDPNAPGDVKHASLCSLISLLDRDLGSRNPEVIGTSNGDLRHAIHRLLDRAGASWEEVEHEPARTAKAAARARGRPVDIGAKSIVLKTDDDFRLFVLSGGARIRSRLIRHHLGVERTRFATPTELAELTGLEPGAVPPFGEPILPLELFADPGLLLHQRLAFTPGVRDHSILIDTADYLAVARPQIFSFAAPSGASTRPSSSA